MIYSTFFFSISGKDFLESLLTYGTSGPAVAMVCCDACFNIFVICIILGLGRSWCRNCRSCHSWIYRSNQSTTWYDSWWLCYCYWKVSSCFLFVQWILFLSSRCRNIVHGSDSEKAAKREVELWFRPEEILNYHRAGAQHLHDKYNE
jgi:hypothetical protein